MNQIIAPSGIPKHCDAIGWINRLMIDLKLQLAGQEPTAPIDERRLQEFPDISRDLLRCQERDTTSRWNTRSHPKHREAVDWLNHLIIDLHKPLLGYDPGRPVTLERLAEFREHRGNIEDCMTLREVVY